MIVTMGDTTQTHIGQVTFTASEDKHPLLHDWYGSLPASEAKRGIVEVYHKAGAPFSLFILCTGPFQAEHEAYSRTGGDTREKVLDFSVAQFERWIKTQDVPRQARFNGDSGKVSWSMAIPPEDAGPRFDQSACQQIEENITIATRLLAASETAAASPEREILDAAYPEWLSIVGDLRTRKFAVCAPTPFLEEDVLGLLRETIAA